MPQPCIGSTATVLRTSRSSGPWRTSGDGALGMRAPASEGAPTGCRQEDATLLSGVKRSVRVEVADRKARGGAGDPTGHCSARPHAELDYYILSGAARTDAALRVTRPPRDPGPRGRARGTAGARALPDRGGRRVPGCARPPP